MKHYTTKRHRYLVLCHIEGVGIYPLTELAHTADEAVAIVSNYMSRFGLQQAVRIRCDESLRGATLHDFVAANKQLRKNDPQMLG